MSDVSPTIWLVCEWSAVTTTSVLYTLASPAAAFTFAAGAMIVSLVLLAAAR